MKIALFIDYGPNNITKELMEEIRKHPFPRCRVNIVSFIQKNGKLVDETRNVYELGCSLYEVKDIDISRPWTIEEYDGSEYVQYMDYKIIDEKLNYGKFKSDFAT